MALTNVLLPYLQAVAANGLERALRDHAELRRGVYLHRGRVVRESLALALGLPFEELER
jgi:alanine dehydrogenase